MLHSDLSILDGLHFCSDICRLDSLMLTHVKVPPCFTNRPSSSVGPSIFPTEPTNMPQSRAKEALRPPIQWRRLYPEERIPKRPVRPMKV